MTDEAAGVYEWRGPVFIRGVDIDIWPGVTLQQPLQALDVPIARGHIQGFLYHALLLRLGELLVVDDGLLILEVRAGEVIRLGGEHLHQPGIAVCGRLGDIVVELWIVYGEVAEVEGLRWYRAREELRLSWIGRALAEDGYTTPWSDPPAAHLASRHTSPSLAHNSRRDGVCHHRGIVGDRRGAREAGAAAGAARRRRRHCWPRGPWRSEGQSQTPWLMRILPR